MIEKIEKILERGEPSKAEKILKKYKGKDEVVWFLYGETLRMLGDFEGAVAKYQKALSVSKDKINAVVSLLGTAACYRTLGHGKDAFTTAEAALKLSEELEDKNLAVSSLQEMGMALRASGDLEGALDLLNEVLAFYQAEKEYGGTAFILWAKGGIFRLQGQFKESVKAFKDAAVMSKKAEDKISLAYAYCGLAGVSRIAGDLKGCVEKYRKADAIFKHTEDLFGKAYTNCGMANGLRQQGKYAEAMKRYTAADKLYSQIKDRVDLGFVKWGKADILKKQNKLKEALAELNEAGKLFDNSDEKRGQILTALSLAQVLYAMGQKETAVQIYDTAVAKAKAEGLNTYLEIYT